MKPELTILQMIMRMIEWNKNVLIRRCLIRLNKEKARQEVANCVLTKKKIYEETTNERVYYETAIDKWRADFTTNLRIKDVQADETSVDYPTPLTLLVHSFVVAFNLLLFMLCRFQKLLFQLLFFCFLLFFSSKTTLIDTCLMRNMGI